ncbi:alpha-crystallin B chain-like protein [Dinothrombium tinctorium]|uniref:Alpha-crystallin B chain-like protein n=1 Tax=Dinothrombium tinctorium TaxID=1965070 RepID=A0A443RNX4_9ACAR|nr:alpha-crystallin B chain-like protein [Dinothrombium tinctorium]
MGPERKVPVLRSDFNLIDTEFNSIRGRFDAEMRKMEEEMNKFRSSLLDREKDFFGSSTFSSSTQQKTTTTSSSHDLDSGLHRSEYNTWLSGLNSPLVQDTDDGKMLKLRFDVTEYQPEEIVVKTVDNRLQVHAKHEEKTENKTVYKEYNREFLLPKGVNPELIRSSLSKDGVLTVEAPLPAIEGPKERKIPISHN